MNQRFSIILPVKNGGEYVKECVKSILSQTLNDFNLIVLDNCSTDGTLQWMQSLNDGRIVVHPATEPLSIEDNWGKIVSVPKNKFMTIIGHDDILKPDYLKIMNELIKIAPDASLYQTHFTFIDSNGQKIRSSKPMKTGTASEFLQSILQKKIDIVGSGFMMRSEDYDQLGGIPHYPNLLFADFELWIRLAALNYYAVSPSEAFSFRLHQSTTSVSSDVKFQKAFEKFIFFLENLKHKKNIYNNVIKEYANIFLIYNYKGFAHRLLRTPKKYRNNLTVTYLLQKCMEYSILLTENKKFHPMSNLSLLVAKLLDSNIATRSMFLFFKKIYPKPILK